jgi:RNA polymerase primary sigma factor
MGRSFNQRSGAVSRYLSRIGDFPILTEEEERKVTASLRGRNKSEAVHRLVESNLPFVVMIASQFKNPGLPLEDLLNEGNIGLIEAAHHFDHLRGTRFLTYAVWWIRKSILRALSRQSSLVRIPGYQMKKVRDLRATERALAKKLGRKPDREEISRELQTSIARIDRILQAKPKKLSLEDKVGRLKGVPISEQLVDPWALNPEKELLREESQELIRLALKTLSDLERAVIINRFGLDGAEAQTLDEIGERLGITGERVRQIEFRARKRLRKLISRNQIIPSVAKQPAGGRPCPA